MVLIVYIAFNIMWVILKVNCTGIGLNVITTLCRLLSTLIPICCHLKAETKARFQHENLGMRLVHSWMCGVVLSLYPLQAYMQLSEFDKSRSYLIKAGQLLPGNAEIRQELEKLDRFVSALAQL